MKTLQTKSYAYNEAVRSLEQDKDLSRLEQINFITNPMNKEEHGTLAWNDKETELSKALNPGKSYACIFSKEAKEAHDNVEKTGAFAYNSLVAKELLKILGLNPLENYIHRAEYIVYGTNSHFRHVKDVVYHESYINEDYISIHDITEAEDGKKALLTGKIEYDWLTNMKENEKVRLVCKHGKLGYQSKGQSRRYHTVGSSNLFVKIINE